MQTYSNGTTEVGQTATNLAFSRLSEYISVRFQDVLLQAIEGDSDSDELLDRICALFIDDKTPDGVRLARNLIRVRCDSAVKSAKEQAEQQKG